jgi:hypothetical protein
MTTARLLVGDVFDRMTELEDGSVDLLLTSPPFYRLRSYLSDGHPDKDKEIGSEATPAAFLDTLLELTAEWRRLLAPHGSIAVEIGDTYSGSGGAGGDYNPDGLRDGQPKFRQATPSPHGPRPTPLEKSLMMLPELYAASLAYGRNLLTGQPSPAGMWRVRNIKPWIRSNPPVGALGDKERPATSYVTVATIAVDRYFDLDAVRTASPDPLARGRQNGKGREDDPGRGATSPAGAPPLDWFVDADAVIDAEIDRRAGKPSAHSTDGSGGTYKGRIDGGDARDIRVSASSGGVVGARGVHIRRALENAGILTTHDALDVSPRGYAGAHYAVWPPELVRLLVDEMCPRKVCTTCGKPRRRIVGEATYITDSGEVIPPDDPWRSRNKDRVRGMGNGKKGGSGHKLATTVGWSDCGHETWRPGHVLDPFAGSGTTLAVATGMARTATGIDLDTRNADLALERVGMFLDIDHGTTTKEAS